MPLDKQDLKLIKETVTDVVKKVVKKEMVGFARKNDLKEFVKKSDITNFATKDDLERFKNEIIDSTTEGFKDMQEQINNHTAEIIEIKNGQEEIRLRIDQLASQFEVRDIKKRLTRIKTRIGID